MRVMCRRGLLGVALVLAATTSGAAAQKACGSQVDQTTVLGASNAAELATCEAYFVDQAWSIGDKPGGACSGNGDCLGTCCQCEDGWTGRSDFMNAEGFDCQIFIVGYKIEWALLGAFQIFAIVKSIPFLRSRYASYSKIKESKAQRGERYRIWDNKGSAAMLIWYALGAPLLLITCLVKLVFDDERVGVTWPMTILFVLVKTVFYICVLLFQPSLLEAVMHGMDNAGNLARTNNRLTWVMMILQFIGSMCAVVCVLAPEKQQAVYLSYLGLMIYISLFISGQGYYIKSRVVKTLDRSYAMAKLDRTLIMKDKLSHMQNAAIRQGFMLGVIFLIQFLFPFFWTKHDYVLPITWFIMPLMGLRTARTSLSDEESKRLSDRSMGPVDVSSSLGGSAFGSSDMVSTEGVTSTSA